MFVGPQLREFLDLAFFGYLISCSGRVAMMQAALLENGDVQLQATTQFRKLLSNFQLP
jgi:hypothetical protein